jgi:hypothetical protein
MLESGGTAIVVSFFMSENTSIECASYCTDMARCSYSFRGFLNSMYEDADYPMRQYIYCG